MPLHLTGLAASTGTGIRLHLERTIQTVADAPATSDAFVAPGWVDLQVNGFAGVDYNRPETSHEEIGRSIAALLATGVTRCYPTVITGPPDAMVAAMRNLARARASVPHGEVFDGLHIEGPHISADEGPRGAHPKAWVRPPDLDEFRRWQDAAEGAIRLVTLAPEWPGATAYIEALVESGVVVSIGHTAATPDQVADAVLAGATMATHVGNAAHAVLPRHRNYLWAQLASDQLTASFIVDGIHLPSDFLKVALRAKQVHRAVLVTDASSPAGSTPGRYTLGGQAVDLTADGRVVLAGQDRLAGSALRMDRAIGNVMRFAGVALADAVAMATVLPARAGRVPGRSQGLAAGDRADVVVFRVDPDDGGLQVQSTYLSGERVFGGTS